MTLVIDAIRKRHPAPGWAVLEEVSNSTGSSASRYADAVALGIWPSHGHAIHGFEVKASLSDLKKEFADPTKADAVGKFCDYWWLVVTDAALVQKVAIPETWGVLAMRGTALHVVNKAPKREPTPITRGFAAALIRRVMEKYVPAGEHHKILAEVDALADAKAAALLKIRQSDAQMQLDRLKNSISRFEQASGISLDNPWNTHQIGQAVADAIRLTNTLGRPPVARDYAAERLANVRMREERLAREAEQLSAERRVLEQEHCHG